MRLLTALLVLPLLVGAAIALGSTMRAGADGPCGTSHDAMDAEEFAFLADLQDWRDANLENSSPLTPSGPLNAAAAWFAEYLAAGGSTNGHSDKYGRDYYDRALDCGWPPVLGRMGEGGIFTTTAAQAAAAMPHKEFEVPNDPRYYPLRCIGVGRAEADGETVWIMLLAQFPANQDCPSAQYSAQTASAPSPTPIQTPEPTPSSWRSWVPGIAND